MKAWHVFSGDPQDGSLLVIAPTRNRARKLGLKAGLWDFGEWIDTRANRAKAYDGLFDRETVVEDNDGLPEGAEPFYSDYEL